jgi:hypothetical protein
MARPKLKAKGQRGSWFATVEGELLPCVHDLWVSKARFYCDPYLYRGIPDYDEFMNAIERGGKVILTKSIVAPNSAEPPTLNREGYIGIFTVENVRCDDDGFKFELVERIADLK